MTTQSPLPALAAQVADAYQRGREDGWNTAAMTAAALLTGLPLVLLGVASWLLVTGWRAAVAEDTEATAPTWVHQILDTEPGAATPSAGANVLFGLRADALTKQHAADRAAAAISNNPGDRSRIRQWQAAERDAQDAATALRHAEGTRS